VNKILRPGTGHL